MIEPFSTKEEALKKFNLMKQSPADRSSYVSYVRMFVARARSMTDDEILDRLEEDINRYYSDDKKKEGLRGVSFKSIHIDESNGFNFDNVLKEAQDAIKGGPVDD